MFAGEAPTDYVSSVREACINFEPYSQSFDPLAQKYAWVKQIWSYIDIEYTNPEQLKKERKSRTCDDCGFIGVSRFAKLRHHKKCHTKAGVEVWLNQLPLQSEKRCKICGKHCESKQDVLLHCKTVHPDDVVKRFGLYSPVQ